MIELASHASYTADLTLREQLSTEVVLTDDEAALLRREFSGVLDPVPTPLRGIYALNPRQYAGLVVLPTGRVIEIRPKVRIGVLFAMLAKAHRLAEFDAQPAAYRSVADLFEFVAGFFAGMVEDLVAQGILRGYVAREEALLALRGKVLVTETIRNQPVIRDRHWCAFTEFTADVSENRILKLTCDRLLPFPYRRIPELSCRLRRLLRVLADVTLDVGAALQFEQLTFHRLNDHYRPALALAQLLLSCLSLSGSRGSHQFLSFLVDMNALFEKYVTVVLQEAATERKVFVVIDQDTHNLDLDRQVVVRPDVVIYSNEAPRLALDAKYKLDDPNTDVYQALAYCHALALPRAILAYPASEGVAYMRHRIRPDAGSEVVLLPLDLSGDIGDLRQQTRAFTESVWREAVVL